MQCAQGHCRPELSLVLRCFSLGRESSLPKLPSCHRCRAAAGPLAASGVEPGRSSHHSKQTFIWGAGGSPRLVSITS